MPYVSGCLVARLAPLHIPTDTSSSFVCSTIITDLNRCCKLRSYPNKEYGSNTSIVDTALATWASPGLFAPFILAPGYYQEEFVGGDCTFSNPTKEAIQEAHAHFGATRRVGSVISLGFNVPKAASFNRKSYNLLKERVVFYDTERVAMELKTQLGDVGVYHRYALRATQDPLYSLQTDSVPAIIGEAKGYIGTIDSELNTCIIGPPDHTNIVMEDLCRCFSISIIPGIDLLSSSYSECSFAQESKDGGFTSSLTLLCHAYRRHRGNKRSLL